MNNIKVLVVDDNQELVSEIKEYFSDHANINVSLEAYDGEIALKLIKEYKSDYDVVILDLVMPKKDGLDVLEEISKWNLNKKIIVISSYNSDEMIRKVSNYGIDYYLTKPFEMSNLEKKILSCFDYKKNNRIVDIFHYNLQYLHIFVYHSYCQKQYKHYHHSFLLLI